MTEHRPLLLVLTTCATAAACVAGAVLAGCDTRPAPGRCPWRASKVAEIDGFDAPECALADPTTGKVYVGNMAPDPAREGGAKYWSDDGVGFVSRLAADGEIEELKWAASTDEVKLHSPKGMCIVGGKLWAADNRRVLTVGLATGKAAVALDLPGAEKLNDMATDGKHAYVSDTGTGRVTRLAPGGPEHLRGPAGANGLAFRDGKLFCVSWTEHEMYEIDLTGKEEARSLGLADRFANLDGIEALPDGSFIVSDQPNNRIAWVSADCRVVETLVEVKEPADIGLDAKRMRLYVPSFQGNCVTVFTLHRPRPEACRPGGRDALGPRATWTARVLPRVSVGRAPRTPRRTTDGRTGRRSSASP